MYPLLFLSVISIIIILERIIFFSMKSYRFSKTLESQADPESKNPLMKIMYTYLSEADKGEEHCVNVSSRVATKQIRAHERGLKLLATIGAISPLVGLLGTVWGMVQAFAKMADLGSNVTPGDFAGGIWTGLLTTVAGLLVAIPAVVASRIFDSKVDRLVGDCTELASHLKERCFPTNS